MWEWTLVIVVAFLIFLCFTRWLGSRETEDGSAFLHGLRKIRDACCGGKYDEDEY